MSRLEGMIAMMEQRRRAAVPTFDELIQIMKVWRVSLAALIHRLHRINVLMFAWD